MIRVYLDTQYPKNLADGLSLLHQMQYPKEFEIIRTNNFEDADTNSVVFLFDRTKKGIDLITEKHYEEGYKVFAFKSRLVPKVDIFQLSLSVLSLWPKIVDTITSDNNPFIFTYKYSNSTLKRIK
jgi:hypothetical protein